jgi:hypothetical protein
MCRSTGEFSVAKFEHLVREWHPSNVHNPHEVWKWADTEVKWKCETCSHEWVDSVKSRVRGKYCPECHAKVKRARMCRVLSKYTTKVRSKICAQCGCEYTNIGRGPKKFCSKPCFLLAKANAASLAHEARFMSLPKCATDGCEAKVWHDGNTHCKVCQKRANRTGTFEKWSCCTRCGEQYQKRKARKGTLCAKCKTEKQKQDGYVRQLKTCEACGNPFSRRVYPNRESGRACSRECGWKLLRMDKAAGKQQTRIKRENAKASRLVGSLCPCCICDLHFVPDNSQVNTCSRGCKRELQLRKIIAIHYGSYEAWLNKRCADCSGLVEETGSKRRYKGQYCLSCASIRNQASKKAAKYKRRRLANGVTAKHPSKEILKGIAEMIRNAGHKCSLCGLMMTRDCDPNSDRHIELDHKVPLSRGGTDTFDNIRAVCRKCNGLKSDFTSPELVLVPRLETLDAGPMDSHINKS